MGHRFFSPSRLRLAILTAMLIAFMAFSTAAPVSAATVQIPPTGEGNPLTIWIGDTGSFQERVKGNSDNSFYPRSSPDGTAGFALAFPSSQSGAFVLLSSTVWGWAQGNPNPDFISTGGGVFTSDLPQGSVTGSGTELSPYRQVTNYHVEVAPGVHLVDIQQTTTYVNGSSTFVVQYHITHPQAGSVRFRAMVGADLYLNSSDCGTGVLKIGPPRFVGGTSLGRVGGFTEEPSIPWTRYFEGQISNSFNSFCQTDPDQSPFGDTVWDYLTGAASGAGFPDTTSTLTLDNGLGVQWDDKYLSGLGAGQSFDIQLNTLGTVPELKLSPSSQSVTAGAQAALNASVTHGAGTPAPGATVRFSVAGANSGGGSVTTDGAGQAGFSYKPGKAGTDTVTAFEDIDGNGVQGTAEPGATATVTVKSASGTQPDKTPPRLRIIVRRSVKLEALLKGLTTAANSNEAASLRFELLGPAKPKAKIYRRNVARRSLPMGKAGTRAVRLKPKRKKLPKAKKFKLRVRVTATDRAGNRAVATKLINVKNAAKKAAR
jgi:hypothetical protein